MSTTPATRTADPLVWGEGPRTLEVFLEPTCPFSGRAFGKFDELLQRAGPERLRLVIRLLPQPWHCFTPVLSRLVLAASCTEGGKTAARAVLAAIFAHREAFEPAQHCQGPVLERTPAQLIEQVESLTGLALRAAFEDPALTAQVKWQARYARQNGAHVTPTFMIDGLIVPEMGSGDPIESWLERLGLA